MAKRAGILVSKSEHAETRPSPNAEVPWLTVEIRAHWPRGFGNHEEAKALLRTAYEQALAEIDEKPNG